MDSLNTSPKINSEIRAAVRAMPQASPPPLLYRSIMKAVYESPRASFAAISWVDLALGLLGAVMLATLVVVWFTLPLDMRLDIMYFLRLVLTPPPRLIALLIFMGVTAIVVISLLLWAISLRNEPN